MRSKAGLAHGLRGAFTALPADLAKARSSLPERNSRAKESDERGNCRVDLEKIKAKAALARGGRRGGNLHGTGGVSGRVSNSLRDCLETPEGRVTRVPDSISDFEFRISNFGFDFGDSCNSPLRTPGFETG